MAENYIVEDTTSGILKAKEFDSSNLNSIRYSEEEEVLEIEFKRGGTYQYKDVPMNIFEEFCNAESKGKFFTTKIKPIYKYRPID